ncbi:MAG: ChuX/HutX family heme-like substrate-binding protein [Neisseria sp.]|uniref:ChuX/HutX family heme-like substrate-binding protein n=1 Tax=Neisseria sp. TaxID=192066 RepID=UPI0026DC291A|nr:ChuX/HutX family heme-like substrate-binding protein [Neisseria sp.]MDO4640614.1 ChuX/HutX family heme-like substrate-binding protein [Neisseria sp.]
MSNTLYQRYLELKKQGIHQRDAVARLGVSEGELIASFSDTQYLGSDIMAFLPELVKLGEVKSAVRNSVALHEKKGLYKNLDLSPMMGTAINLGGLDLRLFLKRWKHILAVKTNQTYAFHFYDAYGKAIEKVFVTDKSAIPAWEQLCQKYSSNQQPVFEPAPPQEPYQAITLPAEKIQEYQQEWQNLKNVHHFRIILAEFGIDRLQGLEYAPEKDAQRLNNESIEFIFKQCAQRGITLLIFVNNSGMVQIQTGKVHHVGRAEGYLNILDEDEEHFSFYLKDDALAEVWFVRRPGSTGIVHSLEAYNSNRELVLQLFGRPADAEEEPQQWRDLITETLETFKK